MLLFTEIVTKIMQTRGKKACFLFPECSLSYTKIWIKNEMGYRKKKICYKQEYHIDYKFMIEYRQWE